MIIFFLSQKSLTHRSKFESRAMATFSCIIRSSNFLQISRLNIGRTSAKIVNLNYFIIYSYNRGSDFCNLAPLKLKNNSILLIFATNHATESNTAFSQWLLFCGSLCLSADAISAKRMGGWIGVTFKNNNY
jgi:hypothetical protein